MEEVKEEDVSEGIRMKGWKACTGCVCNESRMID